MKIPFPTERNRRMKATDLIRESASPQKTEFDLEQEVSQEDWEYVWAVIDKNTIERPVIHGGGHNAWDHLDAIATWVALANPVELERLRSDPRIRTLGKDCLRSGSYDAKSDALGMQLFPELVSDQAKSDSELLEIYTPHLVAAVGEDKQRPNVMHPSSEEFVKFLQLRPRELEDIQKVIEAHPNVWSVFEEEFQFYVSRRLWRLAAEAAANMTLLKPETQSKWADEIRPYLPQMKAALQKDKSKRKDISTENWGHGELYILESCKLMSSLAIVFGHEPRVNDQGCIEVNKSHPLARASELPARDISL